MGGMVGLLEELLRSPVQRTYGENEWRNDEEYGVCEAR